MVFACLNLDPLSGHSFFSQPPLMGMSSVLARYQALLQRAPLRTNLCTAVPMMVVGDLGAQQLERRRRDSGGGVALDAQRTLVMASYSVRHLRRLSSCPTHHHHHHHYHHPPRPIPIKT